MAAAARAAPTAIWSVEAGSTGPRSGAMSARPSVVDDERRRRTHGRGRCGDGRHGAEVGREPPALDRAPHVATVVVEEAQLRILRRGVELRLRCRERIALR